MDDLHKEALGIVIKLNHITCRLGDHYPSDSYPSTPFGFTTDGDSCAIDFLGISLWESGDCDPREAITDSSGGFVFDANGDLVYESLLVFVKRKISELGTFLIKL